MTTRTLKDYVQQGKKASLCVCNHPKSWHDADGTCPMPRATGGGPCWCVKFTPQEDSQ